MKIEMKQARQGDVLLVRVSALPGNAVEVKSDKRVILALGEVTGHAHAIEIKNDNVKLWDANAERFVQALEDVTLRHEEHGEVFLGRGIYRQAFQAEDFGEEVRRVAD